MFKDSTPANLPITSGAKFKANSIKLSDDFEKSVRRKIIIIFSLFIFIVNFIIGCINILNSFYQMHINF